MADRVIVNKDIIELELQKVPKAYGANHLTIRIISEGGSESRPYFIGITPTLFGMEEILKKLSIFHKDFIYWLIRRLFIREYNEKGMDLNENIQLGSTNYESLIGIGVSKNEALLILLRMIKIFVEDNSKRPIDILELFLSCDLHIDILQKAIDDASRLHKLIIRRGDDQVRLIDGQFDELKEKIDDLENRNSVKPMKIFHEVEITLNPPFGFLLIPFKDKKGFKYSDFKDHLIPHIKTSYNIDCHDVRESKLANFVNNKIYTCIKKSDFVIADITGFNPNVFYELGITHLMGRVNIVVGRDPANNLPFDIDMFDYDRYSNTDDLKKIIDSRLPSILKRK